MPEIVVKIGGRDYSVACEPGEEKQLQKAAALLDTEATALQDAIGRVAEPRMLLMAGLMLADRAAGWERRIGELEAQMAEIEDKAARIAASALKVSEAKGSDESRAAKAQAEQAMYALERVTETVERLADQVAPQG